MMSIRLYIDFTSLSEKQVSSADPQQKKESLNAFGNSWGIWLTVAENEGENTEGIKDQIKEVKVVLTDRSGKLQWMLALQWGNVD